MDAAHVNDETTGKVLKTKMETMTRFTLFRKSSHVVHNAHAKLLRFFLCYASMFITIMFMYMQYVIVHNDCGLFVVGNIGKGTAKNHTSADLT